MSSPADDTSGATPAAHEAFLLSGGGRGQFATAAATDLEEIFEQYVNFYAEKDNFSIGAQRPITVDGAIGFTVDLTSRDRARQLCWAHSDGATSARAHLCHGRRCADRSVASNDSKSFSSGVRCCSASAPLVARSRQQAP